MTDQDSLSVLNRYLEAHAVIVKDKARGFITWVNDEDGQWYASELVEATCASARKQCNGALSENEDAMESWLYDIMRLENEKIKFTYLCEVDKAKLRSVALKYVSSLEDAEDLIQDVYEYTLRYISRDVQSIRTPVGWLLYYIRLRGINTLRPPKVSDQQIDPVPQKIIFVPLENEEYNQKDEAELPDEVVIDEEYLQKITHLLTSFPLLWRTVLSMRIDGHKPKQIGEMLSINENRVKTYIERGKSRLRRIYFKQHPWQKDKLEKLIEKQNLSEIEQAVLKQYLVNGKSYAQIKKLLNISAQEMKTLVKMWARKLLGIVFNEE